MQAPIRVAPPAHPSGPMCVSSLFTSRPSRMEITGSIARMTCPADALILQEHRLPGYRSCNALLTSRCIKSSNGDSMHVGTSPQMTLIKHIPEQAHMLFQQGLPYEEDDQSKQWNEPSPCTICWRARTNIDPAGNAMLWRGNLSR